MAFVFPKRLYLASFFYTILQVTPYHCGFIFFLYICSGIIVGSVAKAKVHLASRRGALQNLVYEYTYIH